MGQDGRLRIAGLVEFLLGSLPHQAGEGHTEGLIDPQEGVPCLGESLGEIPAHADPLGPLPGEEQHAYHRITVAPQVNPAPKVTNMISMPGLRRPSSIACASARGIEAAEVLP